MCWLWTCLMLPGVDSQAVPVHAETDWLRCSGWGHGHGAAAQQSFTAGEAHHIVRDRDICRSCPHQERTTVVMRMITCTEYLALCQILSTIDLFLMYQTDSTDCLPILHFYSAQRLDLFVQSVRLNQLSVVFWTQSKSLQFHSFIHSLYTVAICDRHVQQFLSV